MVPKYNEKKLSDYLENDSMNVTGSSRNRYKEELGSELNESTIKEERIEHFPPLSSEIYISDEDSRPKNFRTIDVKTGRLNRTSEKSSNYLTLEQDEPTLQTIETNEGI